MEISRTSHAEPSSEGDNVLRFHRPSPVGYPRLAPDLDPIGGRIRVTCEDFLVEEIPLYRP